MSHPAQRLFSRVATPTRWAIFSPNGVRRWQWRIAALGLLLLLGGCAPSATESPTPTALPTALPTPVPNAVTVVAPLARPAPLVGGNGAIYLTLTNGRDVPVQVVSAESPAAATVEIHETAADNGIMRMRHLPDGVTIPPQGSIRFQPGGLHFMLVNLVDVLTVGESIELTLHLEADAAGTPVHETLVATILVGEPDRGMTGDASSDVFEDSEEDSPTDSAGDSPADAHDH